MKLYELPVKYAALMHAVENWDGEMVGDVESEIEKLFQVTDEEVANSVKLIKNWEAQSVAAREESQRLTTIAVKFEKAVARRKAYIVHVLREMKIDAAGQSPYAVRVQRNSQPSATFEGVLRDLPLGLLLTKYEFDKASAKDYVENGIPLPPGVKVEQNYHLRIV